MYRKLLVGMGTVLGLLTYTAAGQAQGPQFNQVTQFIGGGNGTTTGGITISPTAQGPFYFFGYNNPAPGVVTTFGFGTDNPVKIVQSTATYQDVYLTINGASMWTITSNGSGPLTPVKLQIFVTLGSKPAPAPAPAGSKVAKLSFKAINAAGQVVFASGPMTGAWK